MRPLQQIVADHQEQKRRLQEEAATKLARQKAEREQEGSTMTTTTPTPTEPFAAQKTAGTWFDGFMIGLDKADAAADLRAAIGRLYDAFENEPDANEPTDDAERAAFVMRTAIAISVEEVHRRASARFDALV